jgi:hypothetical protein
MHAQRAGILPPQTVQICIEKGISAHTVILGIVACRHPGKIPAVKIVPVQKRDLTCRSRAAAEYDDQ